MLIGLKAVRAADRHGLGMAFDFELSRRALVELATQQNKQYKRLTPDAPRSHHSHGNILLALKPLAPAISDNPTELLLQLPPKYTQPRNHDAVG